MPPTKSAPSVEPPDALYRRWEKSLPRKQREQLRELGCEKPLSDRPAGFALEVDEDHPAFASAGGMSIDEEVETVLTELSAAGALPQIIEWVKTKTSTNKNHPTNNQASGSPQADFDFSRRQLDMILQAQNPRLEAELIACALGLYQLEGLTGADLARRWGMRRQTIHGRLDAISKKLGLPEKMVLTKRKSSSDAYRHSNWRRVGKNPQTSSPKKPTT